jgi:hypothetical protein
MVVLIGTTTLVPMLQQQQANAASLKEQDSKGDPHKILSLRIVQGQSTTVSPGVSSPSQANCASDEIRTGGGFRVIVTDSSSRWQVETNEANTANGWSARVQNIGSNSITLVASAECLKLVPPP